MRRTKGFLEKLLQYAEIAKQRVVNCPLCPECHQHMRIAQGKGMGARFWICENREQHKNKRCTRASWDSGLSEEHMHFLKKERGVRAKYRKKRRTNNQSVGLAPIIRKKWKIRIPQNKLPKK